jgi:hypothetical protein
MQFVVDLCVTLNAIIYNPCKSRFSAIANLQDAPGGGNLGMAIG